MNASADHDDVVFGWIWRWRRSNVCVLLGAVLFRSRVNEMSVTPLEMLTLLESIGLHSYNHLQKYAAKPEDYSAGAVVAHLDVLIKCRDLAGGAVAMLQMQQETVPNRAGMN